MNSATDVQLKRRTPSSATAGSANSWQAIEGYEPMEECVTATGQEVGWVRPRGIGKHRPQPWGTSADWPGEWEAIPRGDWELAKYCASYEAAKAHVESSWPNADLRQDADSERGT